MLKKINKIFCKRFYSPEKYARTLGVKIGSGCFIGIKDWGAEPYLIEIGDNCAITAGVKIFTHGGARVLRHKYPDFDCFGKVIIGNYVYLGNNTLVMPGCTIGNNVLCAAGSVVTKSIPSGWVVAGNPAKFVCTIEEFEIKNLKYNTHSKMMGPEDKKSLLLSMDETLFIKKQQLRKEWTRILGFPSFLP